MESIAARFRCQWCKHDDKIRLAQKRRQIDSSAAELLFGFQIATAIGVEDAHVEACGAFGDFEADSSEADNAECGMVNVTPKKGERIPRPPTSLAYDALSFSESPSNSEDQSESEVRRGFSEHPWRVGEHNASPRERRHVDVIVAHRHIGDDLELGCVIEEFVVDAFGDHAQQGVRCPHALQECLSGDDFIRLPHLRVASAC